MDKWLISKHENLKGESAGIFEQKDGHLFVLLPNGNFIPFGYTYKLIHEYIFSLGFINEIDF